MNFKEIVRGGCSTWNIDISDSQIDLLEKYAQLLVEKNKVMNLTAITEMSEVATKHMLDCLYQLQCVDFNEKKVVDIGSGGGFPGIPLQICTEGSEFLLIDSRQKRVDFLAEVCSELNISSRALSGRAEELVIDKKMRETFDIAVSRAVAPLNILCELCLPFVKIGGYFLAMKSDNANATLEINQANFAMTTLGGRLEACDKYILPNSEIAHQIIVVKKIKPTPPKYPRRYSKIEATPIK